MNDCGVRCRERIENCGTPGGRALRIAYRNRSVGDAVPGVPCAGTTDCVQFSLFVLIDCHGLLRKPRNDITGQPICHCEAGAHTGCGNLKLPNLHKPVRFLRPPLRGKLLRIFQKPLDKSECLC